MGSEQASGAVLQTEMRSNKRQGILSRSRHRYERAAIINRRTVLRLVMYVVKLRLAGKLVLT